MKKGICVVIPTLNEEKGIVDTIRKIPKKVDNWPVEILVIDGHSKDKTIELAKKEGAKVVTQKGRGKGIAMIEAIGMVDSEILVYVDGDNTYDVASLEKLVAPIINDECEMAVASRIEDMENGAITSFNKLGNIFFNLVTRLVYRKNIRDMLSGYRAIKTERLQDLSLTSIGFEIETELTVQALENNFRIKEIPLHYRRRSGNTKLNPIRDGYYILRTLLFMIWGTRPLRFFGLVGFSSFIAGVIVALRASLLLGGFLVILGVQLISFGVLADMNLKSNKRLEVKLENMKRRI